MNLQALYRDSRRRLKEAGTGQPDLEARLILRHVLPVTDAALIGGDDAAVPAAARDRAEDILSRRLSGEPLSRIFGTREFWGMTFRVTPDVLDPRPDTETLVDAVLAAFRAEGTFPRHILDMGTGSGCILAALLKEFPGARGAGLDLSPAALEIAAFNLAQNGLAGRAELVRGGWDHDFGECRFDLILSNPPYIPSEDIPNLSPEVRNHDPILALDGGADGLDAYRAIVREMKNLLAPGGRGFFEVGVFQSGDVARLVEDAGFLVTGVTPDLAGISRVVGFASGDK